MRRTRARGSRTQQSPRNSNPSLEKSKRTKQKTTRKKKRKTTKKQKVAA
jgi:hypothetical protein